jgi:broad specificity phosphatase PhoE
MFHGRGKYKERPMKNIISMMVLTVMFLTSSAAVAFEATYYVVRHAEKMTGSDPMLTAAGTRRAINIANFLKNKDIKGVYTTKYKRTILTGAPTAAQAHVTPIIFKPNEIKALVKELKNQEGHFLIVAHSNSAPSIASALSGVKLKQLDETEYEKLFIIRIKDGKAVLEISHTESKFE